MKISDSDLRDLLTNYKLNRTGQYICDCPFCGKERHFYVSKSKQAFDCKKCGESGNIYKLLRHFNKLYLLQGATVEQRDELKSLKTLMSESSPASELELAELPIIALPKGFRIVPKNRYLNSRGLTSEDIKRYGIGVVKSDDWKIDGYVIIPVKDNGEIRGYVGRYGAKHVPKGRLRYSNSVGVPFGELLYGYDEIPDGAECIILVEGCFDKFAVDRVLDLKNSDSVKCVATFGKKISDAQIKKLMKKGVRSVLLLYDFDAIKEMKRYGMELAKYFDVLITYTTKKDIDECTEEEALEVLSSGQKPADFSMSVAGKLRRK
nr:MAG TPA: DNA primase (bacterial type) [Caudoviricetes sp.]